MTYIYSTAVMSPTVDKVNFSI